MAPLKSFHPDLAVEILARLPVKSLLRFRCVSKSWESTITDPVFSKLYQPRPCLLISKVENGPFRFACLSNEELLADCYDGSIDGAVTYVPVPWGTSADELCKFEVMGCCNGLVCVYSKSTGNLTLWNPSTRKFNTFPSLMKFADKLPFFCGIGYDQTSDDYKVVQGFINDVLMEVGDKAFVLSLKSNAWKRIRNSYISSSIPAGSTGILLGGALHWLAIFGSIIAFDLAKEKFEVLPHPQTGHSLTEISVLGEHLCLCSKFMDNRGVDVWIMKEYGVKSSWTKMFRVPHETLSRYESNYVFAPLLFLKEDEIVAKVSGTGVAIVRCNTRDMRLKDLMLWPNNPPAYAFLYMESLTSPLVNHQT